MKLMKYEFCELVWGSKKNLSFGVKCVLVYFICAFYLAKLGMFSRSSYFNDNIFEYIHINMYICVPTCT